MHITRSVLLLLSGAMAGIAFILSCGDNLSIKANADAAIDAPKAPDAAPVCDCPAAEPPLANRLVMTSGHGILGPNWWGASGIYCPPGAQPISGSCTIDGPYSNKDVILTESGFLFDTYGAGWRCSFHNNEPTQFTYTVAVLCLKPAP